jgi:hypothetical protein
VDAGQKAGERWSSWMNMLGAAAILMITMGIRQTSGLFIDPINTTTGLGIVAISFALPIAQFVWGWCSRCSAPSPISAARAPRW